MSKFFIPTTTSFFTDLSVDLFSNDCPETAELIQASTSTSGSNELQVSEDPTPTPTELNLIPESTSSLPKRVTKLPKHFHDYHLYSAICTLHEPQSFREAVSDPLWQQAMTEELQALEKAGTWEIVDLPPEQSVVGCKWVYKIKTKSDGTIERYKARLVAKGFTQEYGIDYDETFAPVARLTTVRCLIAIAAAKQWALFQMDVKNAFLNGDLDKDVYMQPPPGSVIPANKVCHLKRALYGLKQAPRAWFDKFSKTVLSFGFSASDHDSALFIRRTNSGFVLLLLYVDDMIITGDDIAGIHALQKSLSQEFEMKDLGHLSYFLGLEVTSSHEGYYLSQAKYTSDLIARAGLTDNVIVSTPLEPNSVLNQSDGTLLSDATRYRQLVGSLVYLTVTRPDIAHAVHLVSQYMSAPRTTHYTAIFHILRYLKGTLFYGLHFPSTSSLVLRAYSDSDYAGDPNDRRSTTGYCFYLGDSLICWRSKKQSVVSRSSSEAEYRAIADTTSELIWLRSLVNDLGFPQDGPTTLHCDNQSAIHIAHNDVFHERTKHIEVDCHFTRQHIRNNIVQLQPIASRDQLADIFTKNLPSSRFRDMISKLKIICTKPS